VVGNRIVRHGLAKSKGGIGLHTTGITRRHFSPNLHRVKARVNGAVCRLTVCTSCIKGGKVTKA
jgi:large subunit ribosomal protein L28